MTKANITQYSSTPSSNADINDINIAENCPASGLNNAIRELMAHLKNVDTGSQALTALSVAGSVTATTSLKTPLIEFTDGDNALTIADGGNVTANADFTVSGDLIASSLNGGQFGGRRNIVINGAMQVFQRGTSHTSITTSGYRADRFRSAISNLGTWTITQDSDAPSGFSNSLKYDCTTADASPSASNNIFIQHKIEGQNVQHLKKGTSDAEKVTVQFYVKCNKTGNVQCNIRDRDNTRQISSIITINSANTWEKKVFTIVGDTTGTLDNDNESSFEIEWWLDAGSNYTTGTTPTAWEAVSETDRAVGTTIALGDSTDNYFQLTGVQMEVGEQATSFEHRSFGEELALCQRYFETGNINSVSSFITTNVVIGTLYFATTKRANPAVSYPTLFTVYVSSSTPSLSGHTTSGTPSIYGFFIRATCSSTAHLAKASILQNGTYIADSEL
jgi:hypothetical protein